MLYRLTGITILVLFSILMFSGCYAYTKSPAVGLLYTNTAAPVAVGEGLNEEPLKEGTATAKSILGLIAVGDASIRAAVKSAGIRKIHYVDYTSRKILGLYAEYTVHVYGE